MEELEKEGHAEGAGYVRPAIEAAANKLNLESLVEKLIESSGSADPAFSPEFDDIVRKLAHKSLQEINKQSILRFWESQHGGMLERHGLEKAERLEKVAKTLQDSTYAGGHQYGGTGSCTYSYVGDDHSGIPLFLTAAHCVMIGARITDPVQVFIPEIGIVEGTVVASGWPTEDAKDTMYCPDGQFIDQDIDWAIVRANPQYATIIKETQKPIPLVSDRLQKGELGITLAGFHREADIVIPSEERYGELAGNLMTSGIARGGFSGSCVFNEEGECIGVHWGGSYVRDPSGLGIASYAPASSFYHEYEQVKEGRNLVDPYRYRPIYKGFSPSTHEGIDGFVERSMIEHLQRGFQWDVSGRGGWYDEEAIPDSSLILGALRYLDNNNVIQHIISEIASRTEDHGDEADFWVQCNQALAEILPRYKPYIQQAINFVMDQQQR